MRAKELDIATRGGRLRAARIAAGLSVEQVADRAGYSASGIRALENGQNDLKPDPAEILAPIVRSTAAYLLTGAGAKEAQRRTVRLVGYVGAGAEAHYYASSDELGEVDAPEDATPDTVAVEIRGTSLGPLFETWLIFYDEVQRPVTTDQIGQLCVVGLPNGKILVKRVRRASNGHYHLESNSEPTMFDQEIEWAARVKTMKPR